LVFAPLLVKGKTLGSVTVVRHGASASEFTPPDIDFIRHLADHAALAILNANLLTDVRKSAERLRILSEAARDFSAATGDHARILDFVAERVGSIFDDLCVLRLVSTDGQWLEPRGSVYGADSEVVAAMRTLLLMTPQRADEGILGRVVKENQSLRVLDMQNDPRLLPGARSFFMKIEATSVIVAPISTQGRIIGVLSLTRRTNQQHTEDDLKLLEDLAAHASLAIANSRLLEAAKRELAERMLTEAVLRRGFLEAAPDAVMIFDSNGRIVLVNSRMESLFGYSRVELVGQSLELLVPQGRALTTTFVCMSFNTPARRKDQSEFVAEISLSPIESPEGRLFAAAIRDVSERERQLQERNRRMEQAHQLKGEFNAIIGFASLIHEGHVGPVFGDQREYIGDILKSAQHLLHLINDVLDLAKIESGKLVVYVNEVELSQVVSEIRDVLRGLPAFNRIKLALDLDSGPAKVAVDVRMLKQILYNFLSNAFKFSLDGGTVRLRIATLDADWFRIDVEDNGIGIKEEDFERLFVEFQQLDAGASKKYGGTGLGLALTKRLVEAQGGRVEVRSVMNKGSVFSAILPREVQEQPRPSQP
jgi:protein-histidine pros-kinase